MRRKHFGRRLQIQSALLNRIAPDFETTHRTGRSVLVVPDMDGVKPSLVKLSRVHAVEQPFRFRPPALEGLGNI
jgi:hypothetical protein